MIRLPAANVVFESLMTQPPIPLARLTGGGGIYALEDECGIVRYIGETEMPFHKRIHDNHVAGDENSHKYSSAFNAGRLWHLSAGDISPSKRAISDALDGKHSKTLRRLFTRSRCHARVVHLPELDKISLKRLEDAVLAITPVENKRWNDKRQMQSYEPEGLDEFVASLIAAPGFVEAVNRQGERWNSLAPDDRIIVRKPRNAMKNR